MCYFCKKHTVEEGVDHMFHGENKYTLDGVDEYNEISCEIYINMDDDDNFPHISAIAELFGGTIHSHDIPINYCPFCGRKL